MNLTLLPRSLCKKGDCMSKEKKYSSIQVSPEFLVYLKKVKDLNHFNTYENTIKYLIVTGKKNAKK